jgi:ATP-binding cassette subfamily F protein 3
VQAETRLADTSTYDDKNREKLQQLLFRQADNKRQLEELEMEWFEISEEIEQLRSEFEE